MEKSYNKWLYGAFVALSVYYAIRGDWSSTCMNLGIALVFDPFNQAQKWGERPLWQRVWLIVHLAILAGVFGFMIGFGDKGGMKKLLGNATFQGVFG